MNREIALKEARRYAEERNWIMVVFEGKVGDWYAYNYEEWHELGGFDSAALFVLPHGEITGQWRHT